MHSHSFRRLTLHAVACAATLASGFAQESSATYIKRPTARVEFHLPKGDEPFADSFEAARIVGEYAVDEDEVARAMEHAWFPVTFLRTADPKSDEPPRYLITVRLGAANPVSEEAAVAPTGEAGATPTQPAQTPSKKSEDLRPMYLNFELEDRISGSSIPAGILFQRLFREAKRSPDSLKGLRTELKLHIDEIALHPQELIDELLWHLPLASFDDEPRADSVYGRDSRKRRTIELPICLDYVGLHEMSAFRVHVNTPTINEKTGEFVKGVDGQPQVETFVHLVQANKGERTQHVRAIDLPDPKRSRLSFESYDPRFEEFLPLDEVASMQEEQPVWMRRVYVCSGGSKIGTAVKYPELPTNVN